MRKLVDAPRKKKQWTEKEEAYLQDKWGTVSIKGLSKALGRSENAIIVRAQRLGCGAHLAGDTRISLNQLMLRREDEPVRIKYQIQTLRKGEKQWQKLRSGREAKTKPEGIEPPRRIRYRFRILRRHEARPEEGR